MINGAEISGIYFLSLCLKVCDRLYYLLELTTTNSLSVVVSINSFVGLTLLGFTPDGLLGLGMVQCSMSSAVNIRVF